MREALILGAGFSRAISDAVPLTDELGQLVLSRLGRHHPPFTGGYFEMWLSRLAEPQPDLPDHVNTANHALFWQIAAALHDVLVERELQVLSEEPPPWLLQLVATAHARKLSLLTFNYDTLVEQAVNALGLRDWNTGHAARSGHVVGHLPPYPQGSFLGPDPADSFHLLKLHGSIDNYWVPNDSSGATISRLNLFGSWGSPRPPDEGVRRQYLPGRSPFIVPPAAAKSAFYNNPITREIWQSAAKALAEADSISLVGYSLPQTDLVASGMLSERINRGPVALEVVNLYPDPVAERLRYLGAGPELITTVPGEGSIPAFVTRLMAEASRDAVNTIANTESGSLVLVSEDGDSAAVVVRVTVEARRIMLYTSRTEPIGLAISPRRDPGEEPISTEELRRQVLPATTDPMVVVGPEGEERVVIDVASYRNESGAGDGTWVVLVPAPDRRRAS